MEDRKLIMWLCAVGFITVAMVCLMLLVNALKLQKDIENLKMYQQIVEDCKITEDESVRISDF